MPEPDPTDPAASGPPTVVAALAASAPRTAPAAPSRTIPEAQGPLTLLGEHFPLSDDELRALRRAGIEQARALLAQIDASPTPYHAVQRATALLATSGFEPLDEASAWRLRPGDRRYVVRHGSSLIAFVVGQRSPALTGFRLLAAHTDSPTFRLKPKAARSAHGYRLVGVEPYGGAIQPSWLDRDLSIAGRVLCRAAASPSTLAAAVPAGGVEALLVDLQRPVARMANVAIHLGRKSHDEPPRLDPQRHLPAIVGLGRELDLRELLATEVRRAPDDIVGFDLCLYDTQPGAIGGLDEDLVFSGRLDNLASAFTALRAIGNLSATPDATAVVALYDHEECGSRSAVGAGGTLLRDALERIAALHPEAAEQAWHRARAQSWLVSADMAHALHPNYADLHDGEHAPLLNRGLVLKSNANQSYATSGIGAAFFAALCARVGYEPQHFVTRSDLRGGSTIGPVIAADLGVRAVDVGAPMLSMHSCREMAGTLDVHLAVRTFEELFVA
jgi:aspartyl aminopeptidase